MLPPIKSGKQVYGGRVSDESEIPSSNLWVGNLPAGVTDSDLMSLFSKFGAVDSISSYESRTYAFVYYKRVEDAKAAVEALRGAILRGNPLRIDFAKPAKPCKSLWVSGISPSITKETLEQEFLKFGKIEEFKFLRDRNTAYVDYFRLEDASQALKSMNGKRIGGDHIRVDFLRSHSTRREHLADYRDAREGQFLSRIMGPPDPPWMPKEANRSYPEPTHSGSERQLHLQSSGRQMGDGPPSNILWILYPPSVLIDEQMLHNAMILFGEIERIRSFPGKPYMFVEFRSVDEARRAKEGLQGRLFNDPRISILYSSSELAPSKDFPGSYPEVKGPRADVFFNEPPFRRAQLDIPNHNRPVVPNTLSGPVPSSVIPGPNMLMRPFGPQGSFEPPLSRPEFNDLAALHKLPDTNPNGSMGGPNWRRSPPAPGMLPSPSLGAKRPTRAASGAWDVFDASQLERESKRSRVDTVLPVSDIAFHSRNVDDHGLGLDQFYGVGPQVGGGASGPLATVQPKNRFSPAEVRITTSGANQCYPDHDYLWRGVIAKGGTPVCRARCVPIGKGIEFEIPEVVNCSARTGLDLLSKHHADATGYDIVFFLPDSEEDFASYTEFLRYLGSKDRAGVAKFDDGTTLFLVPPSDFLSKVLNIVGPQRLYGVVLKFPQHAPSSTSMQPQSFQPHFMDRGQMLSQNDYSSIPQKEEEVLQMDYNKVLHEDSLPSTTQLPPPTSDSIPMQPATSVNTALVSQAGLLTPQLIATLASFLPANATSSATETAQTQVSSASIRPPLPPSTELVGGYPPQGWTHDRQGPEQPALPLHQVDNQYKPQGQEVAQLQIYPTVLNTSTISALGVTDNSQVQDPSFHLPQQGAASSRPFGNIGIPSQSGQVSISPQFDQVHQYEVPQNAQKGFGIPHVIDSYGSSAYQQPANHVALSDQIHSSDVTQAYTGMQLGADKGNSQFPNQVLQHQSVHYGASQGTSEVGDNKNQRYHSALQFAFNLLNQVQQKSGSQSGQGSANH